MKKLNKKIILEFLDDEAGEPAAEASVVTETPVVVPSAPRPLSEAEKKNFIITTLTDISAKALDFFNYLTPMMTIEVEDKTSVLNNLSEENKDLLRSIYEDVSLIVGKVTQALKDNTEENVQNAIDDGQTQAQETIAPEVDLKEDLNSDKEKLWDDLMADVDMGDFFDDMQGHEDEEKEKFLKDPKKELQTWKDYYKENPEMLDKIKAFENKYKEKLEEAVLKEAPDKYGLPTDDELSSEADRIRREYDQKIKDLYSDRDAKRKEIKLREFNEVLNKLNSNPALEKLKNQITNNEILKFNVTDEKSGLMAYSFGDG